MEMQHHDQEQSTSQSIIEQARASEQSAGASVSPGTQKAKKRGRPPGSAKKAESAEAKESQPKQEKKQQTIETKVLCYPVVRVISNAGVAVLKDQRAKMSMEEAETCAEGLALLFDKYLPQVMSDYGVEIAAFTAFGQYGLKLYALKQLQIKEAAVHRPPQSGQEASKSQESGPGIQPDATDRAINLPESDVI